MSFKMPTNPFGSANCWVEMLCPARERERESRRKRGVVDMTPNGHPVFDELYQS
jgi:hypothetical protein